MDSTNTPCSLRTYRHAVRYGLFPCDMSDALRRSAQTVHLLGSLIGGAR
jgi:hypothetical protein